jgi:oxygen-independent coproporphyrinogen-3 oxidase
MTLDPLSIYIHIPFCSLKCSYCDFNSYAGMEAMVRPYVDALIVEMGLWREATSGQRVETVFFGGGTPSLLPIAELERVMATLRDSFEADPEAEVSLEANPGTVDLPYLRELLELGVNRLSLGVQSVHADELAALDRIHTAQEAEEAYRWAREAGFRRISLDLIYGLPQTETGGPAQPLGSASRRAQDGPIERWRATLNRGIELGPEHLSLYALTVEEGTKLAYDIDHGRAPAPDPDAQAEMYEWSQERLAEAGYEQYEISNWSRPGEECRHNLVYWQNGEWLGLGAGAHSHLGGRRFADVYSPKQYVDRVRATAEASTADAPDACDFLKSMRQVAYVEEQTPELAMADTAILGLRLNEGLSAKAFEERFGRTLEDVYDGTLGDLAEAGLIEHTEGRWRLTKRGRLLANEVFVRLLPD